MKTETIPPGSLAIVTGAAKRLGKAITQELAKTYPVIGIHYHSSTRAAEELALELAANGIRPILLQADLSDTQQITTMFGRIKESGFLLKTFVNSASIMIRGKLHETSLDQWNQIMNINLRAAWLCIKESSNLMHNGGQIINISDSGAGRLWTNYAVYSMSKAGMDGLTKLAAKSLAPEIRVNAIAPGLILPPENGIDEEWDRLVKKLPLKKSGTQQDITRAVRYLLDNEHITGHTLVVDGGYQLISV